MNEQAGYISTAKFVTIALWVTVAAVTLAGWVVFIIDYDYRVVALMLEGVASTLSAAAAVAHLCAKQTMLAKLIRINMGLVSSAGREPAELHRIH